MIAKHLWPTTGPWRSKETRHCLKCGASVKLVAVPRGGSRVFVSKLRHGTEVTGAMSRCEPVGVEVKP